MICECLISIEVVAIMQRTHSICVSCHYRVGQHTCNTESSKYVCNM